MATIAYVGVGSNVGNARSNVRRAIRALGDAGCVRRVSAISRTQPWGRTAQAHFANAVVRLETLLAPHALLDALQRIERRLGRRPSYRWGPRVVDLDVLAYDRLRIDEPGLSIPHPHLGRRPFMLVPLEEVLPRGASPPRARNRGFP